MSMMLLVDNCTICGKVYQKNAFGFCMDCRRKELSDLQSVIDVLYRARKSTMQDLLEATGLDESRVTRFILEGKVPLAEFPNLYYRCDSCGTGIREHKRCISCLSRIRGDIERMLQNETITGQRRVPHKPSASPVPAMRRNGGFRIHH